jgi:hypothetical protein
MKAIKKLIYTVVIITLSACVEEVHQDYDDVAKRSKKYFEEDKKKVSKDFVFPDSVLNKPIIASYFEEGSGAHSMMFYTDTALKLGKVIRYFPDKSVLTDRVKCTNDKQFVSVLRPEIKYLIDADRVFYTCWRGDNSGIAFSFEHLRTDGNRR